MRIILALVLLLSSVGVNAQQVLSFESLTNLLSRPNPRAFSQNGKAKLRVEGYWNPGDWGAARDARWTTNSQSTNFGGFFAFPGTTNGFLIFDDCYNDDGVRVEWFGALSDPTLATPVETRIQAAIDFVTTRTNEAGRKYGGTVTSSRGGVFPVSDSITLRSRLALRFANSHYSDINFVTTTVTNTSYLAGSSVQFVVLGGTDKPLFILDPTDPELFIRQDDEPQEDGSMADSKQYSILLEGFSVYIAAQNRYDCHAFKFANAWGIQLRDIYVWTRFGYAVWAKDCNALKIQNSHLIGGHYGDGGRGVLFWGTGDSKIIDSEIGGMIGPGIWITGSSAGKDTLLGNQVFNQQRHRQQVTGYDTATDLITLDGSHLLETGMLAEWAKEQGATPTTNINIHQPYWVIKVATNSLKLATTEANALAGVAIDFTGAIAGTNYVWSGPGASLYGSWNAENMVVTGNRFEQNEETGIYLSSAPGWSISGNMTYYNQYDNEAGALNPISVPNIYLRGNNTGTIISGNSLDADAVRYGPDYGIEVEASSASFVGNHVILGPNGIRNSVVRDYQIGTNNNWAIISRKATNEASGYGSMFISRLETAGIKAGNTNAGSDVTIPLELQTAQSGVPVITARRLAFPKLGIRITGTGMGPGNQNGWLFMNEEEGYFGGQIVASTNTSTLRLGGTGAFQLFTRDAEVAGDIGGVTDLPSRRMVFNPPLGTGAGSTNDSGFIFRLPIGGASGTTAHSTYDAFRVNTVGSYFRDPVTVGSNATPNASAILDLVSTSRGLLPPRMTTAQRTAISGVNGLIVYDSDLGRHYGYQGGAWVALYADGSGGGGSGTNSLGINGTFRTDWNLVDTTGLQYDITATTNGGVRLKDRDWGDVTSSGSGLTLTIDNDVVTYAKLQNVSAASRLLGRGSASGAGDAEELTIGSGLLLSGTTLSATGGGGSTNAEYQSGPLPGRAGTFGDYIRSIYAERPVSVPTEPRLLLLAPIGGQSLATGSGGVTNAFSTTPRHPSYSLMWAQGVHYGEPGTGGVVIASSALTAVSNLYADVVTGPVRSENPVVAAVDYWNTYWSNSLAGNRAKVLAVGHGLGGANLTSIDEGTASFSNLVAHMAGAATYARAQNLILNIPAWFFVHGENDTFDGTPVENYRTNFLTMYGRMKELAKGYSGQTNDPIVIMTQTASRTYENVSNSWAANAQLFLGQSDARIKVAVPTYVFPTVADGVHLTNIVSAWLGEYLSKAARYELFGGGWDPVHPTNITISGTNVVINYHAPKPPLVFDTTLVSNPGAYGYALDGATIGTPTVSGNTVTIPFTAGSPTRVKYGWNGTLGDPDGPTTGQRGNLRDSDDEAGSLTSSNLYNWGLIFNLPTTPPATPTGLAASGANGQIALTWNRMDDTAVYRLKRGLISGGPYTEIETTSGISFTDTDVAGSVTYYYVVVGHGPSGDSAQSAEVSATISGGGSITRNWVPTDLGAQLKIWLRASSLSAGAGNPISTWTDESGNGYHFTGSSTTRPNQETANGRPVVRFDGVDDHLDQTGIGPVFSGIGQMDVWSVGAQASTNAVGKYWWWLSRTNANQTRVGMFQSGTTAGKVRFGGSRIDSDSTDNDDSTAYAVTNAVAIWQAEFDFTNGDKRMVLNGTNDVEDLTFATAGSTAAENVSRLQLGSAQLAAGPAQTNWLNGDIEMFIVTTGVISSDNRLRMEGYIAHALGITNLLNSSHIYKTTPPQITTGSSSMVGINGTFRTDWNLIDTTGLQYDVTATTNAGVRLKDRDWGDVTSSGSGLTLTIDNEAVTYAKLQNVSAASRLLGRGSASGAGDAEELTIGSGLLLSGTTLSATGGTATFSTNLLGYIARSVTQVSISNSVAETEIVNFVLPGNTLNTDGDEFELFVPSTYMTYAGQSVAYSWDLYLDYDETPTAVSGDYSGLVYISTAYAQTWTARVKRMSTNTASLIVTHILGSDDSTDKTNHVEQTRYLQNYTLQNSGGWSSNFNFALTVTLGDSSTSHRVNTFGYTVAKVGSASAGGDVVGPASSVSGELAVFDGTTGKLLRAGGAFKVSQSTLTAHSAGSNYVVDPTVAPIQLVTASADVNVLHATNAAAGRGTTLLIQASGANRILTLPANMKRTRVSVTVTNGSVLPVNFYAFGADNTNVVATVGAEGF